jgi:hypothetical protein
VVVTVAAAVALFQLVENLLLTQVYRFSVLLILLYVSSKFRIVATFVNTDLKQGFLMQYICKLCGSPVSVTIPTGLPKIIHSYRHETVS